MARFTQVAVARNQAAQIDEIEDSMRRLGLLAEPDSDDGELDIDEVTGGVVRVPKAAGKQHGSTSLGTSATDGDSASTTLSPWQPDGSRRYKLSWGTYARP